MSLLYSILYAAHARGTHHKIALRALPLLKIHQASAWRRLFLKNAGAYLEGSKAPDVVFRDFQNHVLHLDDGDWGGAPQAATRWYEELVTELRAQNWPKAAYAAGVLSHYYSDPLMPLHTGGSEAEANIHRAAEWSVAKSFEALWRTAPDVDVPTPRGEDWVAEMVRQGARAARSCYWPLIAQFDFEQATSDPASGLNGELRSMIAPLLAHAVKGIAMLFDRAFEQAAVTPPAVTLSAETALAALQIPVRWVVNNIADAEDRALVLRMHAELLEKGVVADTLPDDVRAIREASRQRASQRRSAKGRAAASHSDLSGAMPVERAPSIGRSTASRLAALGIHTILDLVAAEPERLAARLGDDRISSDEVAKWRDQAALLLRLPRLRGAHAVMLVAAGYRDLRTLAGADPTQLRTRVAAVLRTKKLREALRDPQTPDLCVVVEWIGKARGALAAADASRRNAA